ncbi:hypothetical protein [Prosthecobacter sp.]|uniref:hypothetical protein n=1 Tax=Prosthecobacter sp. TaxID=1965333 RepID=UPI0024875B92|nr:hypothetical protein [Prosthecobacter sp.]MDI1311018.1 hypothetical protein [Prosthecobacter sp.]
MRSLSLTFLTGLLFCFMGSPQQAAAEPIQVKARFVREDGSALAGMAVRMVIGSEKDSRAPQAGRTLTTDGNGGVTYTVNAPIKERKIQTGSAFFRSASQLVEVGIEMELLGRRALYWVELDLVKAGPMMGQATYVAGSKGDFDRMLKFNDKTHSWSFPDDPKGMQLTGTGANVTEHSMRKNAATGRWEIDLTVEKQKWEKR